MLPFKLLKPTSFDEAIQLLTLDPDHSKPIAGGTALMLMMKSQIFTPTQVISLRNIKDSSYIKAEPNSELKIGALTKLSDLENSALIAKYAPVICHAMIKLSNVRVRNSATIGGALSPYGLATNTELPCCQRAYHQPEWQTHYSCRKLIFRVLRNLPKV